MNCKETEKRIWDYIEGKLPEDEQRAIAGHMEHCASCAALEKGLRGSLQLIDNSRVQEQDPYFYARLEARMQNKAIPQKRGIAYAFRYAMAASVALIAIVGGSLLGSYSAVQLNNIKQGNTLMQDDLSIDLADNSFDLIKDFE